MRRRKEGGFTLVEVLVVAAIVAILAGVLVPMIFSQIDEARISRAKGDLRAISSSILTFRKDVGRWPACNGVTFLKGEGNDAVAASGGVGYDVTTPQKFSDHLVEDSFACYDPNMWKGPYIGPVDADPWGNQYFLNAAGLATAGKRVFVLSAGPDGTVETGPDDTSVAATDIGIAIK